MDLPVAAAPPCPPPRHSMRGPDGATGFGRLLRLGGPGIMVAVGYMDPGNWATDIEAGARYGNALLFVVVLCGLAAMLLQGLAMRLGIVAERDLARLVRDRYPRGVTYLLWLLAEMAIVATDIAEVLGSALAFKLLFGLPLWLGVLLTALDTILILALQGHGLRRIEAIILALVTTITISFAVQLVFARPDLGDMARGLVPSLATLRQPHALYLAVGILGATVMPHNLYLHSSLVQARAAEPHPAGAHPVDTRRAIARATRDTIGSLALATFVNAAILGLAAAIFHAHGHLTVATIEDAYRLIAPITGASGAAILFGVALLASGQSATFTGTIAGQVVLEGFLDLRIAWWKRRLITRGLALVPALLGVLLMGDGAVGRLLVLTQIVLSVQLPFTLFPLIRFAGDRRIMGIHASGPLVRAIAWMLFLGILAANLWLVFALFG